MLEAIPQCSISDYYKHSLFDNYELRGVQIRRKKENRVTAMWKKKTTALVNNTVLYGFTQFVSSKIFFLIIQWHQSPLKHMWRHSSNQPQYNYRSFHFHLSVSSNKQYFRDELCISVQFHDISFRQHACISTVHIHITHATFRATTHCKWSTLVALLVTARLD